MPKLVVTASALNLRATPSIEGDVIELLNKGDIVESLGASGGGYWQNIKHGQHNGWAAFKYLQPEIADAPVAAYPWFDIAEKELGVAEMPDSHHNPRIVEYLRSTTLSEAYASKDETAWCSAFVNFCVEKSGYAGTDSAAARSWLKWGKPTNSPVVGTIVVFEWTTGGNHVAFYVSQNDAHINALGGNQSNKVCHTQFRLDNIASIEYRQPR